MSEINRRDVLRYGAAFAATGTAAVAMPGYLGTSASPAASMSGEDPRNFAGMYRGKRVVAIHSRDKHHRVTINGKSLAIMSFPTVFTDPDGTERVAEGFISTLTHFEPMEVDEGAKKDGLRKIAERAVDILGGLELSDEAGTHHVMAHPR